MMYGEADAAAAMGISPRRAAGPGADLRVQGLERRRRRRVERDHVRRPARSARGGSRRSTRRSSTTSRARAPRSSWSTATLARSCGRRSSCSRRACPARHATWCCSSDTSRRCAWRTFSTVIVELAEALGTQLVVTLGALLADVPHTRPISVTGLASDSDLVTRLGLTRSSYEGPTGIVGVLHAACQESGLPSASLWAAVPHYIAAAPNPKAALALVRKLEGLVRRGGRRQRARVRRRRLRAPGQPRRAERPRRRRRSSSASSRRRPARRATRGPLPPATRSPASSSGSCASAGTTSQTARRQLAS